MKTIRKIRTYPFPAVCLSASLFLASGSATAGDFYDQGLVYYSQGQYQLALEQFNQAVSAGETGADYMLMKMHAEGLGVSRNDKQAFQWALKSAESGIMQAQYQLAEKYVRGEGTKVDYQQAFRWCKAAADQGHPLAIQQLGHLYEAGLGVARNEAAAQHFYSIAASELDVYAQQGDPASQNRLALMYEQGKGVKTNLKLAVEWYQKAAMQGFADAQYNMGRLLANGQVEQNLAEARYWLEHAAAQGHNDARSALAKLKRKSDIALRD